LSPQVAAIIVNYNAGALLRGCVDSILSSEVAIEIIIVDNASNDSSLSSLCASGQVQIIRNPTNLGFAAACNIGIGAANAPFLFFVNPDCYFQTDPLPTLLAALQAEDRIGMVGGFLVNNDGTEQGGGRRAVPTPWRSFVRAFGLYRFSNRWPHLFFDFHLHNQPLPRETIDVEAISGACMLVKREAVNDVGLWDEGYFLHCEDLDWCMRFWQNGWKIRFVPSARVYHALGACSKSRRVFVEWHKHKGMVRYYDKFFSQQYTSVLMWPVKLAVWLRFGLLAGYLTGRQTLSKFGLFRE
jgi:GT2 family glycosyltransferase